MFLSVVSNTDTWCCQACGKQTYAAARQEVSELLPTLHELVQLQVEVVEVAVVSWKMPPNGSVEREHLLP